MQEHESAPGSRPLLPPDGDDGAHGLLDSFLSSEPGEDNVPSFEELLACVRAPEQYPKVRAYLDEHPECEALIRELPPELAHKTNQAIKDNAYYRWTWGGRPHGLDKQHWREGEAELCSRILDIAQDQVKRTA